MITQWLHNYWQRVFFVVLIVVLDNAASTPLELRRLLLPSESNEGAVLSVGLVLFRCLILFNLAFQADETQGKQDFQLIFLFFLFFGGFDVLPWNTILLNSSCHNVELRGFFFFLCMWCASSSCITVLPVLKYKFSHPLQKYRNNKVVAYGGHLGFRSKDEYQTKR